jgi:lipoprotein NlpI
MLWFVCSTIMLKALLQGPSQNEARDALLTKARAAAKEGRLDDAVRLAGEAIAMEPTDAAAYGFRGALFVSLRKPARAIADFSKALECDPKLVGLYHLRGQELFKLARFSESVADFDKYLEVRPSERPKHWQRGISCYYAGKFREGAAQFEAYQAVDGNDVENSVWRFLCQARAEGIEKARTSLLKVGTDKRIPLMQVYALFAGKSQPADVLAAAKNGRPRPEELATRLFYTNLYLGLYFDITGDRKQALKHLTPAAEQYEKHGYMGEVARVHADLLKQVTSTP